MMVFMIMGAFGIESSHLFFYNLKIINEILQSYFFHHNTLLLFH